MSLVVLHARRSGSIGIEQLARESGLHPDVVRRLVRLGLVTPPFGPDAAARLARASRLRRDLGLNYSGAVLATELLARIDELEGRLARSTSNGRRTR
ncbi:MAG TPA: chaperone modulator CbpM [Baekduia sp.]|uniref:chaperone modulator CbpM n=1 Tax=Baekduia sp. TaxID=2600305 RepID=UPI002C12F8E1|nr:chaperone modulator CbpM [Baekduia sp.]HMJ35876.1 chaperone modulator CbpM [Baekduia sp.]